MAKKTSGLGASSKAVDPALNALFASSSGPVKPHPKSKYSELPPPREEPEEELAGDEAGENGADSDESMEDANGAEADSEEVSGDESGSASDASDIEDRVLGPPKKTKERKRKRDDADADDLEARYLNKLAQEEEREAQEEKRKEKRQKSKDQKEESQQDKEDETSSEGTTTSNEDADDSESGDNEDDTKEVEKPDGDDSDADSDADSEIPMHESLVAAKAAKGSTDGTKTDKDMELEKANRTVFLANVASEASSSKKSLRILKDHLSRVLSDDEKIESIRFRSLAFSTTAMPKRAAYITHSLMESTTRSSNAYVVYSTASAARKAFAQLNGTVVLDRHIRVDSVAHPTPADHRRCVFVGNLGFVDDETVLNATATGETKERKRNKVPSDIEEGLWRTFGQHAGKVENVRVVRDPKTRVGKGFAYVQFYDGNGVEAALLLDGKKFPPMLPRALRVTRAKAPHKTALAQERKAKSAQGPSSNARKGDGEAPAGGTTSAKYKHKATPEEQSLAGRAAKLLGRSAALREQGDAKGRGKGKGGKGGDGPKRAAIPKTPEQIIFEGRRASAKDGKPSDVRLGKKGKGGKPGAGGKGVKKGRVEKNKGRGAERAQAWRKTKKGAS